jgi:hypothetical protein
VVVFLFLFCIDDVVRFQLICKFEVKYFITLPFLVLNLYLLMIDLRSVVA